MPLESLGKEELNIKKIETSEPETEDNFDARTKWEDVKAEINNKALPDDIGLRNDYFQNAVLVAQLFPEKRDQIGLDKEMLVMHKNLIKSELERAEGPTNFMLREAVYALISFPDKTREDLGLSAEDRENFKEHVKLILLGIGGDLPKSWHTVIKALIIFPELRDDFNYLLMEKQYKDFKGRLDFRQWEKPEQYLKAAAEVRTLFPQFMNKDEVASLDWAMIKSATEDIAKKDENYFSLLFARQVLAADSVKLTSHGVEFTMPEQSSFTSVVPPLPETKKQ